MFNFPLCRAFSTRLIDGDSITGDTGQNAPVKKQILLESGVSSIRYNITRSGMYLKHERICVYITCLRSPVSFGPLSFHRRHGLLQEFLL